MAVTAPFRFARIHRWVYEPKWGPLISHDVPFADGLCGEIEVQIEATTPLLMGGDRRKGAQAVAGQVWPFKLADGTYAINGTSIQGMVRATLEIAGFGRLGDWIDDRRVAYRDLGGSQTADVYYKKRMNKTAPPAASGALPNVTPNVLSGWMFRRLDGKTEMAEIVHCEHSKIDFNELQALSTGVGLTATLRDANNASVRYTSFLNGRPKSVLNQNFTLTLKTFHPHPNPGVNIFYSLAHAAPLGGPSTPGTVVITGKAIGGMGAGRKKREFVFHAPDRSAAPSLSNPIGFSTNPTTFVSETTFRDFVDLHSATDGRAENPNWTFWRVEFNRGDPIPVFYLLEGGKITTVMMAFMGKAALNRSFHKNLRESSSAHFADRKKRQPDLPTAIFGEAADADAEDKGLKRRASFDLAKGELPPGINVSQLRNNAAGLPAYATVLLGPKPSYFPIYMRQPTLAGGRLLAGMPHVVSGMPPAGVIIPGATPEHISPELAGLKIWPSKNFAPNQFPNLPAPPAGSDGMKTHVILNAVPTGTKFTTTLRFHNLRAVELGAVLWALTLGDVEGTNIRRRLGMGKPYGLGNVKISLSRPNINRNDGTAWGTLPKLITAFTDHMQTVCNTVAPKLAGNASLVWVESAQVKALIAAGTPLAPENVAVTHGYMLLGEANENNNAFTGYVGERAKNRFLPAYVTGQEFRRPGPPADAAPAIPNDLTNGMRVRVWGATGEVTGYLNDPRRPSWQVTFDNARRPPKNFTRDQIQILSEQAP